MTPSLNNRVGSGLNRMIMNRGDTPRVALGGPMRLGGWRDTRRDHCKAGLPHHRVTIKGTGSKV